MLKPLGARVIVKTIEAEKVSGGGIIIPDNVVDKPTTGEIIAVGADVVASDLQVGAVVLFGKYTGVSMQHKGEDLIN